MEANAVESSLSSTANEMEDLELKTNGCIIRTFGKKLRLRDSIVGGIVWFLLSTILAPLFWFKLVQGKLARPTHNMAQYIFQLFACCGSRPNLPEGVSTIHSEGSSNKLRFVAISDTHSQHHSLKIPDGDVLIHCGDFTNHGSFAEVQSFAKWFLAQPHKHKVLVPGNHDMIMDKNYYRSYWNDWSHTKESTSEAFALFAAENVHVLLDSGVEVEGVKLYGSPHVPQHTAWKTAFNEQPEDLPKYWKKIPDDVDVLLTHSPPAGKLDREPFGDRGGCAHLLEEVQQRIKPKYHIFGHIHSDWGAEVDEPVEGGTNGELPSSGTCFINAASVSDFYFVRKPICFSVSRPDTNQNGPKQLEGGSL